MSSLKRKQAVRRQRAYLLRMLKNSVPAIADKLKVSTRTIERDLEAIEAEIQLTATDWATLRREAMDSLRATKEMRLEEFENATPGSHVRQKLLKDLDDIDRWIVEKVAQPPKIGRKSDIDSESELIMAKFIRDEHPEVLGELQNYLKILEKKKKLEAKQS